MGRQFQNDERSVRKGCEEFEIVGTIQESETREQPEGRFVVLISDKVVGEGRFTFGCFPYLLGGQGQFLHSRKPIVSVAMSL